MTQQKRDFRYLDLLTNIFIVVLLISNLIGQKICSFGELHLFGAGFPLRAGGAQLLFPITYIFGDIFTEVYGYNASRRTIWLGFFASGLLALLGLVMVALPASPDWPNQAAFAQVFAFVPRLVVGSLIAFWCGEFANSYVMAKMKIFTDGRHLWTRTVGSTVAGQFIDTLVVMIVAFSGTVSVSTLGSMIFWGYSFKVIYEVLMTPVTYWIVNALKRREGIDPFDNGTDFNPFHGVLVKRSNAYETD